MSQANRNRESIASSNKIREECQLDNTVLESDNSKLNQSKSSRRRSSLVSSVSSIEDNFNYNFEYYPEDSPTKYEYSQFSLSDKELSKWLALSNDGRTQCVKSVVRLFLTKSSRKESVQRTHVNDVLEKIDASYKKFTNAVLYFTQKKLYNCFGYILTPCYKVIGNVDAKKDEYYLSNSIKNSALQKIISNNDDQRNAYQGFVFVVCQIIFCSPGRKSDGNSILRQLRILDSRFPETLSTTKSKKSNIHQNNIAAIPELGSDFSELINKMKREGYIIAEKEDGDNVDDTGRQKYKLGGRFHNDIGLSQILKSHFLAKNESPPEFLVNMIVEENEKFIEENLQDDKNQDAPTQSEQIPVNSSSGNNHSALNVSSSSSSSLKHPLNEQSQTKEKRIRSK